MKNTRNSNNLSLEASLKDVLKIIVGSAIFLAGINYYSCIKQQGSLSQANNYIAKSFQEGYQIAKNAPWNACSP